MSHGGGKACRVARCGRPRAYGRSLCHGCHQKWRKSPQSRTGAFEEWLKTWETLVKEAT